MNRTNQSANQSHSLVQSLSFLPYIPPKQSANQSNDSEIDAVYEAINDGLDSLINQSIKDSNKSVDHLLRNQSFQTFLQTFLHFTKQAIIQTRYAPPKSSNQSINISIFQSPAQTKLRLKVYTWFKQFLNLSEDQLQSINRQLPVNQSLLSVCLDLVVIYDNNDRINQSIINHIIKSPEIKQSFTVSLSLALQSLQSFSIPVINQSIIQSASQTINFLIEFYAAISAFLPVFPPLIDQSIDQSIIPSIAKHYQTCLDQSRNSFVKQANDQSINQSISTLKRSLMDCAQTVFQLGFIAPLTDDQSINKISDKSHYDHIENTFDTFYSLLIELNDLSNSQSVSQSFLADFDHIYQLRQTLKTLQSINQYIESERWEYLIDILPARSTQTINQPVSQKSSSPLSRSAQPVDEEQSINQLVELVENSISHDFACAVLRECNGDVSDAMSRLFDDSLPARLQAVPKSQRKTWTSDQAINQSVEGGIFDNEVDDSFQSFLQRSGRVLKSEVHSVKQSINQSVFEDKSDVAILKQRIIDSAAFDAQYEDEYDDAYEELLSFAVDDQAQDIDNQSMNVRDAWRQETKNKEKQREIHRISEIEQIPPSKRTQDVAQEYQRLRHKHHSTNQSVSQDQSTSQSSSSSQSSQQTHPSTIQSINQSDSSRGGRGGHGKAQTTGGRQARPQPVVSDDPDHVPAPSDTRRKPKINQPVNQSLPQPEDTSSNQSTNQSTNQTANPSRGGFSARGRSARGGAVGQSYDEKEASRANRFTGTRTSEIESRRARLMRDDRDEDSEPDEDTQSNNQSVSQPNSQSSAIQSVNQSSESAPPNQSQRGGRNARNKHANGSHNRKALASKKMSVGGLPG